MLQVYVGPALSLPASNQPQLRKHHAGDERGAARCSQSPMLRGYAATSSLPRAGGCGLKGVVIQHGSFSVHFTVCVCRKLAFAPTPRPASCWHR